MVYRTLFFFLFLLSGFSVLAQDKKVEPPIAPKKKFKTADQIWNFDVISCMDFPLADLAKRFGTSYRIGLGLKLKTKKNFIYGAKFEFITGKKMREDSLLYNIKTQQGSVINQQGDLLNVGLFERGYITGFQFGKIFPFLQMNANSGPMMLASVGFMQYKINIFDRDNSFPQLRGDYKKGYDRLTNGWYIEDFIGYQYFAANKLVNIYAGFDFLYGFTQVRRDYLLDLARTDNAKRADIMLGFKLGWVVPIYKKNAEETYY